MMRRAFVVAVLTVVWVLLWGSLSAANVVGGIVVAAVLLTAFPVAAGVGRVGRPRPLAALRLAGYVLRNLVVSNVVVTLAILRPGPQPNPFIIRCALRTRSPRIVTTIANVLAMSPGVLPVDVEPNAIRVHVLRARDVERTRASVAHLETLIVRAFGNDEDIARCTVPVRT